MIEVIPMLACGVPALLATSLVMSAAGTVASYVGKSQAASKQKAYQDHLADMQREAAQRRVASLHTKALQEQMVSAQKIEAARQESDRVAAQARLSTEAGGIAGVTAGHLIQTHEAQEGRYVAALQEEQRMRSANVDRMSEDIMLGAQQQMAATQAPINQPNMLASALMWGAGAANSAMASGIFDADPSKKKSQIPSGSTDYQSRVSPLGIRSSYKV